MKIAANAEKQARKRKNSRAFHSSPTIREVGSKRRRFLFYWLWELEQSYEMSLTSSQ